MTGNRFLLSSLVWISLRSQEIYTLDVWEGQDANLTCNESDDNQDSDVVWKKLTSQGWQRVVSKTADGKVNIPEGSPWMGNTLHLDRSGTLTISAVLLERDNGTYSCMSDNVNGVTDLIVYKKMTGLAVTSYPSLPVPENTSLSFDCQVEGGLPAPLVTWLIGETPIGLPRRYDRYARHITLIARRDLHNQRVRCMASQRDYIQQDSIILNITYKPEVIIQTTQTSYKEGEDVDLICSANGNPKPVLYWVYGGNTIIPGMPPPPTTSTSDHFNETSEHTKNLYGVASTDQTKKATIADFLQSSSPSTVHSSGDLVEARGTKQEGDDTTNTIVYTITDFDESHEGEYLCSARNSGGISTKRITLSLTGMTGKGVFQITTFVSLGLSCGITILLCITWQRRMLICETRGTNSVGPTHGEIEEIEMCNVNDDATVDGDGYQSHTAIGRCEEANERLQSSDQTRRLGLDKTVAKRAPKNMYANQPVNHPAASDNNFAHHYTTADESEYVLHVPSRRSAKRSQAGGIYVNQSTISEPLACTTINRPNTPPVAAIRHPSHSTEDELHEDVFPLDDIEHLYDDAFPLDDEGIAT